MDSKSSKQKAHTGQFIATPVNSTPVITNDEKEVDPNDINEIRCPSIDQVDTYVFQHNKKDDFFHNVACDKMILGVKANYASHYLTKKAMFSFGKLKKWYEYDEIVHFFIDDKLYKKKYDDN